MNQIKIVLETSGKFLTRLLYTFLLVSCLSPVDFPTDRFGNTLVVSGQVSTIEGNSSIQLGHTADTDRFSIPVEGATVLLIVSSGESYAYEEDLSTRGLYTLTGVTGAVGKTYFIRITLPTGEVYESIPEKMPESPGEVSSRYEFVQEEYIDTETVISLKPFIKIYSNSSLPITPGAHYIKWHVEETYLFTPTDFPDIFGNVPPPCYIVQNADPQRITLFNGEEVKAEPLENFLIASRLIDYSFYERHYFTTYQSGITKESYEYWRKVNILVNQVGSIFDTPPAKIKGNIFKVDDPTEEVLGYFQATNQVYDRFYLLPDDLPFPVLFERCLYSPNKDKYPDRCVDCLSLRNSSYKRPDWF
jgi:hypothetical protein